MQRRKFLRSSLAATAGVAVSFSPAMGSASSAVQKQVYEWREYELRFGSDAGALENYLKTALIPALNKHGVKAVGVFKEWRQSEPGKLFVLITYASPDNYLAVQTKVKSDSDFIKNSEPYNGIPAGKPVYNRFTTTLMFAFEGFPALVAPTAAPRMFELRTYEGYSEDAVRRKIKMFHDGEFPIFERANLKPVFFGEVVAGDKMPCLTYLLTCGSMEERDKGWSAFVADPAWKALLSDPQYANTISKISSTFLVPTSYSQI